MNELSRNLNVTMLSSHRVDEEKTRVIDEMQQYVSFLLCVLLSKYVCTNIRF